MNLKLYIFKIRIFFSIFSYKKKIYLKIKLFFLLKLYNKNYMINIKNKKSISI